MEKSELKSFWSLRQCRSVNLSNRINFFKVRRLIIEILGIVKTVGRNSGESEIPRHSGKKKKKKWDPAKRSCELVVERLNCLTTRIMQITRRSAHARATRLSRGLWRWNVATASQTVESWNFQMTPAKSAFRWCISEVTHFAGLNTFIRYAISYRCIVLYGRGVKSFKNTDKRAPNYRL